MKKVTIYKREKLDPNMDYDEYDELDEIFEVRVKDSHSKTKTKNNDIIKKARKRKENSFLE